MTETNQAAGRRFWLLRIILIGGLLLLLLWIILCAPSDGMPNPRLETEGLIQAVSSAYAAYSADGGLFSKHLDNRNFVAALSGANPKRDAHINFKPRQINLDGELIDAWGTPFRVSYISDSDFSITSAGPDKIFGTTDDITNR